MVNELYWPWLSLFLSYDRIVHSIRGFVCSFWFTSWSEGTEKIRNYSMKNKNNVNYKFAVYFLQQVCVCPLIYIIFLTHSLKAYNVFYIVVVLIWTVFIFRLRNDLDWIKNKQKMLLKLNVGCLRLITDIKHWSSPPLLLQTFSALVEY